MKFTAHLVNLTPHDITIQMADSRRSFTIAPSGIVARCQTEYTTVAQVVAGGDPFNIRERYFNEPQDLPDPVEGTLYIVSRIVAEACANVRDDLLMVDGTIRAKDGRIVGCEAFARWPVTSVKKSDDDIRTDELYLEAMKRYCGEVEWVEILNMLNDDDYFFIKNQYEKEGTPNAYMDREGYEDWCELNGEEGGDE